MKLWSCLILCHTLGPLTHEGLPTHEWGLLGLAPLISVLLPDVVSQQGYMAELPPVPGWATAKSIVTGNGWRWCQVAHPAQQLHTDSKAVSLSSGSSCSSRTWWCQGLDRRLNVGPSVCRHKFCHWVMGPSPKSNLLCCSTFGRKPRVLELWK